MNPSIDTTNIVIETERLILRAFRSTDLHDFNAYASVPGVGEAAGWPHHRSVEATKLILDSFLQKKENFAIYHKADKKVIGSLGMRLAWSSKNDKYKHLKAKELGYVLSKDYWGRGLVPEAVNAVVDYAFNVMGLDAVCTAHFGENLQSRRVAEKCGFTYVETGTYHAKHFNRTYDDVRYIMLSPLYKSAQSAGS